MYFGNLLQHLVHLAGGLAHADHLQLHRRENAAGGGHARKTLATLHAVAHLQDALRVKRVAHHPRRQLDALHQRHAAAAGHRKVAAKPRHAGLGQDAADDRQADLGAVPQVIPTRGGDPFFQEVHPGPDDARHQPPVAAAERRNRDQHLRDHRQFGFQILVGRREHRHHKQHQHPHANAQRRHHERRVAHGRLHLLVDVAVECNLLEQRTERLVQAARALADPDHVDVEVVEYLRMPGKRGAQFRAPVHVGPHRQQRLGQRLIGGRPLNALDRRQQRHARAHHVGHLARQHLQVQHRHLVFTGQVGEPFRLLRRLAQLGDLDREDAAFHQPLRHRLLIGGFDASLHLFPELVAPFVKIGVHRCGSSAWSGYSAIVMASATEVVPATTIRAAPWARVRCPIWARASRSMRWLSLPCSASVSSWLTSSTS